MKFIKKELVDIIKEACEKDNEIIEVQLNAGEWKRLKRENNFIGDTLHLSIAEPVTLSQYAISTFPTPFKYREVRVVKDGSFL